jgi:DNA-binding beta-propeller fold protein YncE
MATTAQLYYPWGVAVGPNGNLYISDTFNLRVRVVFGGLIGTVAGNGVWGAESGDGGPATEATLNSPAGLLLDAAGNLYIADTGNERIRVVSEGVISSMAGTNSYGFYGDGGPANSAEMFDPHSIAMDSAGNIYIADRFNDRIRVLSPLRCSRAARPGGPAPGEPMGNVIDSASDSSATDRASLCQESRRLFEELSDLAGSLKR